MQLEKIKLFSAADEKGPNDLNNIKLSLSLRYSTYFYDWWKLLFTNNSSPITKAFYLKIASILN